MRRSDCRHAASLRRYLDLKLYINLSVSDSSIETPVTIRGLGMRRTRYIGSVKPLSARTRQRNLFNHYR